MKKKKTISSAYLIPGSFMITILIGALVLTLPVCSATGRFTDPITALFTATTSVCVTGLVVVDTYSYWSIFGQAVILVLIQLGGLGIITVTSALMLISRKKFALGDRMMLQDALNLNSSHGIVRFLTRIITGTLLVELTGALLYMIRFVPKFGPVKGVWVSVFTAISAFCNAGIDILGPNSLEGYRQDPLVLFITMTLIILGGLGYVVWFDIQQKAGEGYFKKFSLRQVWSRFSEHTKLVLTQTLVLINAGAVMIFLTERSNPDTIGSMSIGYKLLNSLFESVTFRTAGFATFPQKALNESSCIVPFVLMFIGGSPVGTAGGIKTVTFFLVLMNVIYYIRGRQITVFRKAVSEEMMRKATAIAAVSFGAVVIITFALMLTNPVSMTDGLFEVVSGCATVGLTRGLTPSLNTAGRLLIILSMYLGRIGPISMAVVFVKLGHSDHINRYTEGNFYVG